MTVQLLLQTQLDSKEQGELQNLQEELRKDSALDFKLDPSFFKDNDGRVQHLLCWDQDQLMGYAALNTFDPEVMEITVIASPQAAILSEMEKNWLTLAVSYKRSVLLIVDQRDTFLMDYLAATKQYVYSFTEYGMVFSGKKLPFVSKCRLEKAVEADVAAIVGLYGKEASPELTNTDLVKTLVLKENNEIIASIRIEKERQNYALYGFVVRADYRGQGLGRKILTQILQQLMKEQAQEIYLEVESTNAAAYHLYQSLGFVKKTAFDYYMFVEIDERSCK